MTIPILLCGLAIGLGVWLLALTIGGSSIGPVVGRLTGHETQPVVTAGPGTRLAIWAAGRRRLVAVSTVLGLTVGLLTGLPVVGVAAALLVVLSATVVDARRRRRRALAKMRAAIEFVEAIRGALGAGAALESAIVEAAGTPPVGLRAELETFSQLATQPDVAIESALQQLAVDVDEPAVDLLVGSLIAALRGATGDMGRLFDRIADQSRAFAETRATTQTERAKVEFQTNVLSVLCGALALLSVSVSPDLRSAYGPDLGGQLRLLVPVLIFAAGWWWMVRLNQVQRSYRFQPRAVTAERRAGR